MLRQLRKRLTHANVVSTLTLFLVLGTGTAYATHLIVNSSDVVDGSLVSADLKNGGAVKAADVVSNALTGGTINESTLAQVPSATLGGLGRSAATPDGEDACNPDTSRYVRCVQLAMTLPTPAGAAERAHHFLRLRQSPMPLGRGRLVWRCGSHHGRQWERTLIDRHDGCLPCRNVHLRHRVRRPLWK